MRLVVMFAIMVSLSISIFADDVNPEKRAEIKKLLTTAKVLESSSKIIDLLGHQMIKDTQAKGVKMTPNLAMGMLEDIKAVYTERFPEFEEMIVVMYSNHFELEDIKEINRFYDTPSGKKLIDKMPVLAVDAMKISAQWAMMLKPDLEKKIKERFETASK
ncbi:MAG: DUF2059 domain-containing protein [Campylobacterota bacterium]